MNTGNSIHPTEAEHDAHYAADPVEEDEQPFRRRTPQETNLALKRSAALDRQLIEIQAQHP